MKYTVSQWIQDTAKERQDSVHWNSGKFKDENDQKTYEAGFNAGAMASRNLIERNCNISLPDPIRTPQGYDDAKEYQPSEY